MGGLKFKHRAEEVPEAVNGLAPWRVNWVLFWSYVRITSLVLGGGYAIIAAAQEEFVRRRHWLTEDDILEMITVTQTVPGILACNSAVYIGWKLGGFFGAVSALIGSVLPSLVIIMCIAAAMSRVRDVVELPAVRGAFIGLVSCIVGMVAATAVRMWKKVMREPLSYVIAAACFIGMSVVKTHPALLISGAILLGVAAQTFSAFGKTKGGEGR